MDEFAFIDWIRQRTRLDAGRFPVGPGDDCAVVRFGGEELLVTTDQCADGVHFILAECGARAAGYKAMARGLSDIAAMAGEPVAAVATVAARRGMGEEELRELHAGLRGAGDEFNCPLIGGDVAAWSNDLLLTVTVLGQATAAGPVLRSGARAGDAICVTGELGGSVASGRHLCFRPRIAEARELVSRVRLHAMIDISDGLAADLGHICRESGVGAQLDSGAIPLSPAARQGGDPLAAALGDGEDYELLFTLADQDAERLLGEGGPPQKILGVPLCRIGRITAGDSLTLVGPGGRAGPLKATGYRHGT